MWKSIINYTLVAIIILTINQQIGGSYAFFAPRNVQKMFHTTRYYHAASRITTTILTDSSLTDSTDRYHVNNPRVLCNLKKGGDDGIDEKEMYLEAMKEAAKDPARFQEFVAEQTLRRKAKEEEERIRLDGGGYEEEVGEKKGYVPIEQWDREKSQDGTSWEEKVRFDGQRFGDRFQQNEILRKNLKSW